MVVSVLLLMPAGINRLEQQYCVTQRELLAVIEFVHHFRHYLLGQNFILRMDRGSLTWIQNFCEPEGQLARDCRSIISKYSTDQELSMVMQMHFPGSFADSVAGIHIAQLKLFPHK